MCYLCAIVYNCFLDSTQESLFQLSYRCSRIEAWELSVDHPLKAAYSVILLLTVELKAIMF